MDFGLDDKTTELHDRLSTFMAERIVPSEPVFHDQLGELDDRWAWSEAPVLKELQAEARELGLWNLFLPEEHADSPGLTNLQYAPLAELTGHAGHLAPAALNCAAPDTGNMEVLSLFGTPEQKERWLKPLLAAEIRSSFAMTEPDVASSDATNIETRIERDGDEYVLNGRKWWITGAMNPHAEIMIVMGKTDPSASRHRQQSQVLVPRDTPGLEVVRGMDGLRVRRPRARRSRRAALHRRPRPGLQPDRRGGRRLRDRPGPPGSWAHPPLHARDRRGRGGDRADVPARRRRGSPSAGRWPTRASSATGSPSPGCGSSSCGCWCSRPPG